MKNPLEPRTHVEVYVNEAGTITIKTIEEGKTEAIAVGHSVVDDMVLALQACKQEIEEHDE